MAVYLNPDRTFTLNGVTVKEYLLTKHNPNKISLPSKRTKNLIGVTLHNTEWIKVNAATNPSEQYTRSTYNGNMNSVRVHYYVDNICAWQNLPLDYQSWHAGHTGRSEANGSEKGNQQTISIECIMDGTSNSYNSKSRDNAAKLAAYMLYVNGFTIDNLYTHNYWENIRNGKKGTVDELNKLDDGYKGCPIFIRPQWEEFKKLVDSYIVKLGGKSVYKNITASSNVNTSTANSASPPPYVVKVVDTALNVRKGAGLNYAVTAVIKKNEAYTIVEEKDVVNADGSKATWGLLKSYQSGRNGWINVGSKYVKKI
ncbi:MAG: N-acetylmuramoyl-L-alanine amidase [Ruminococcus sp.]|nr:N-acetylmuramoyl-L-alanine amidase [Ruminococcus sp.]